MNNKENTKKKNSSPFLTVLLVIFGIVFAVSAFMLAKNLLQGEKEQAAFEELSTPVHQMDENLTQQEKNEIKLKNYAILKEKNPHFAGWLQIEGTKLDYPVMHTPDDMEYYLRRAFDGSYAVSGTPFMDAACNTDSRVVLIYGHHMNNGTMFAALHDYRDKEFWEKHKELSFDTVEAIRSYEVVSVFYTEIDPTGEKGMFDYYNYRGDLSDEDFDRFAQTVLQLSMYDTGAVISAEDRLVVLSTCSYHTEEGRLVLVARLKDVQ